MTAVAEDPAITVYPLTRRMVARSTVVPGNLAMHDALIVATALELASMGNAFLLTADRAITAAAPCPIVW